MGSYAPGTCPTCGRWFRQLWRHQRDVHGEQPLPLGMRASDRDTPWDCRCPQPLPEPIGPFPADATPNHPPVAVQCARCGRPLLPPSPVPA